VKRLWIIGTVLVFAAAALAAGFLMTPRYQATAVLVPASPEKGGGGLLGAIGQLGGLASIAGIGLGSGDAATQEAVAVLESRQFTESFITAYGLLPVLYADQWDPAARQFRGMQSDWPTLADGFRLFDTSVRTLSRNKETGLVTLGIEWTDPKLAAQWANEMVERLNAEMRRRAIERSVSSLVYLEKELGQTQTVETREAISRLVEAQINQRMLANVTVDYAFRFADRALPPDMDDPSWPPRVPLVILGLLLGLVISVGAILFSRALHTAPSA
jgi:uncharacterized protein involved in exopolysaccharide biosynthesis